ncbi:MAG: MFS transporter [Thermomicrobiales bacterium]
MIDNTAPQSSRPLVSLLTANAISLAGNAITSIAIPWYVLATGGSAAEVGLVGFFTILPTVIAAFLGGGIVDRFGRKRVSIIADLVSGLTVATIPLLHSTVGLHLWQLIVLVFLGALLDAPGNNARQSIFPDLIATSGVSVERANSAYQSVFRLSQLLGPVIGGILIAGIGTTNVLWVDAATFAVSAAIVWKNVPRDVPAPRTDQHYVRELIEGLNFIRADRLLYSLALMLAFMNFVDSAIFSVVFPVYIKDYYDSARVLGFLFGVLGGGGVIGAILYGIWGERLPRRKVFLISFTLVSFIPLVLAMTPPLWVIAPVLFLEGIVAGPLNPILMTVRQERVPDAMRGRVFGSFGAMAYVAMPAGILLGGLAAETIGLRGCFIIAGVGYLLCSTSMFWNRSLHAMDPEPASKSRQPVAIT